MKKYCTEAHCLNEVTGSACNGDVCSEHASGRITGARHEEMDRITGIGHFQKNIKHLEALATVEDSEEREKLDEWREPLAIEVKRIIEIQLGTGGPADGYSITLDQDGDAQHGVYYWQDWGTHNEYPLNEEELQRVVELYLYGDTRALMER